LHVDLGDVFVVLLNLLDEFYFFLPELYQLHIELQFGVMEELFQQEHMLSLLGYIHTEVLRYNIIGGTLQLVIA